MHAEASTVLTVSPARLYLRVAALCGLILFFEGYDIADVGYAIPSLVDAWKIPPSAFTGVLTAGNVGLMLGSLAAGLLGDRIGRKPVLITCVATFGLLSVLTAFVSTPLQLETMRFFTGTGLGGGLPLAVALASDFTPAKLRDQLVTLVAVPVPIGFTIGGILASRLVSVFGWPAIFMAGGILPLTLVPSLILFLPESAAWREKRKPRNLPAALLRDGLALNTALIWGINILSYLGIYFILLWMPAILHSSGVSPSRAILATSIYGIGVIASPLLTALFLHNVEMPRILSFFLAIGALCVLAIGLLVPRFGLLALLLCGVGIGGGCQAGINCLSALTYPPAIRSTGTGWAMGVGRIGTIAGPLLGGLLLHAGIQPQRLFLLASIPAFSSVLLMMLIGRYPRSIN
jgi:AAHS family 4-hydroxybenzoate transporter-like MFS transporter